MRISIEFDSCWQTGFLGDDLKKPIIHSKNANKHDLKGYKQKFVATSKERGEKPTPITKNTVLGILCRLVGDQRKLYQARNSENYYFADIEPQVSFSLSRINQTSQELIYLTNKSDDRCAQSTFLGVLSSDNPWFFSDVSSKLWSVLFLNKEQLLDFILNNEVENTEVDCSPKNLISRIEDISNIKVETGSVLMTKKRLIFDKTKEIEKKENLLETTLEKAKVKSPNSQSQIVKHEIKIKEINEEILQLKEAFLQIEVDAEINEQDLKIANVIRYLTNKFPGNEYLTNDVIYPLSLYAAALYIQAERLSKIRNDLEFLKDKKGEIYIQGFSKRGFNGIRDWLNRMAGGRKKAVGTPCIVQKQSGVLDININVSRERAEQIRNDIENAGVSSFYLGKKGLAYVARIDPREVKS
ncbi:type I-Fv CRISPR-associated protein Cas5fv [Methylotuvimicrobium buryatense]|uniref:Cas5fv helical domain-containing protein n=1 Tax=Methylotuvimicrobium buryatense TaxID=95641 RepID=A0A4P9UU92_METBY|nr:type I-Fv CRISPR-associated protein Cas5fv [Methylotuvimicrobium buryatense]QCW83236.1 hypothetical protein EQU24_14040 [Methylotuvimicrobium buryatense]